MPAFVTRWCRYIAKTKVNKKNITWRHLKNIGGGVCVRVRVCVLQTKHQLYSAVSIPPWNQRIRVFSMQMLGMLREFGVQPWDQAMCWLCNLHSSWRKDNKTPNFRMLYTVKKEKKERKKDKSTQAIVQIYKKKWHLSPQRQSNGTGRWRIQD